MLIVMWESGPTLLELSNFRDIQQKEYCFFKGQSSFTKMFKHLDKLVDLSCYVGFMSCYVTQR